MLRNGRLKRPKKLRRQRRLDIELGIRHSSNKARREWFGGQKPEDWEESVKHVHQGWGGVLFMDGVLCYNHGIRLREAFATWEAESRED